MARYTGPKDRISRRFGVPLFGPSRVLEKRNFPPGQHGSRRIRKKQSDYAVALGEKQKLRFQYGVLEKKFRRYYSEAVKSSGITGHILLQLLESRLDNVCYRMGLGSTRSAARQFVSHGHILVNGKRVNITSYSCKPSDEISVSPKASSQQLALQFLDATQGIPLVPWLAFEKEGMKGTFVRLPERDEIDLDVNEQLVVELYSR